ncbi:hypothetical protein, partial [Catenibacterium mitsuokai]|uniref:hypothetical protein n=1 Tax=Catenibacterium mitsuokai TaxID=100886 RepID=UPI003D048A68
YVLLDCKIYNLLSVDLGKEVSYMYYTISYSRISQLDALKAFTPHYFYIEVGFSACFIQLFLL